MPARPAASLRPDHHQQLVELLEVRDRVLEEWRETTRLHREEVRSLEARIIRVRDILAGRDHHQEQLPGTQAVALKPAKGKKSRRRCKHGTEIGSGVECESCHADEAWAKAADITTVKVSKKFPRGGDLTERCTQCGKERGEHAGSKCPPEDDEPDRTFPVEDQVEGVTYEAGRRKGAAR